MNGWAADSSAGGRDKVGKVWGLGSDTAKDPGPWEVSSAHVEAVSRGLQLGVDCTRGLVEALSSRPGVGSRRRAIACRRRITELTSGWLRASECS